jgi:hypothetical protein
MTEVTSSPIDVSAALAELDAHPELWNQYQMRTKPKGSPHAEVDDLWLRYRPWSQFNPKKPALFHTEHRAQWYPSYVKLPALRPLIFGLMQVVAATELGGVLLTRIPPGKGVALHRDEGWHARTYRKFAVMLRSDHAQAFCFEGESMLTVDGEVFEFQNQYEHFVTNCSERERITMVVCIRTT